MKTVEMIIEKTSDGYSAFATKYHIYTVGSTLPELRVNIADAISLHFEDEKINISDISIVLTPDLPSFFAHYTELNVSALAHRIRINQSLLAQYIAGIKKPSAKQTARIFAGVQQLGKELAEISF